MASNPGDKIIVTSEQGLEFAALVNTLQDLYVRIYNDEKNLLPSLPEDPTLFLNGNGAFSTPSGSEGSSGDVDGGNPDTIYGGEITIDGGNVNGN